MDATETPTACWQATLSVLEGTEDAPERAVMGWLAACAASESPPLWVRLARLAVDYGWPDGGGWTLGQLGGIVDRAVGMADAVGAPAASRVHDGVGAPAASRVHDGAWQYTTVTDTVIMADPDQAVVSVAGPCPWSVLRRAVAAARAAAIEYEPDPALVAAAQAVEAQRAAHAAALRVRDAAAAQRGQDRW